MQSIEILRFAWRYVFNDRPMHNSKLASLFRLYPISCRSWLSVFAFDAYIIRLVATITLPSLRIWLLVCLSSLEICWSDLACLSSALASAWELFSASFEISSSGLALFSPSFDICSSVLACLSSAFASALAPVLQTAWPNPELLLYVIDFRRYH